MASSAAYTYSDRFAKAGATAQAFAVKQTWLAASHRDFQVSTKGRPDWLTTLRRRLGVAIGDEGRWLPYITAGAAFGFVSAKTNSLNDTTGAAGGSVSSLSASTGKRNFIQTGFVIGGGLEYAITDKVTLATEYQYVKLRGASQQTVHYSGQYNSGNAFDVVHKVGFDTVSSVSAKLNYHF